VIKQALEAFKGLYAIVEIAQEDIDCRFAWAEMPDAKEAITALRQLLEQPEQSAEPLGEVVALEWDEVFDAAAAAYCRSEASRKALRLCFQSRNQSTQISIGWTAKELMSFAKTVAYIYTTPPAQPTGDDLTPDEAQPATEDSSDVDHGDELTIAYLDGVHTGKKMEKREWVGLTQREWDDLWDEHHDEYGYPFSADGYERAIEAKLREKNGGE